MYLNYSNLILTFEEKSDKLMKFLDEKIKNTSNRQLFDSLKETTDINPSTSIFLKKGINNDSD